MTKKSKEKTPEEQYPAIFELLGGLEALEKQATEFIEKIVKKKKMELTKKDIKAIAAEVIPDLDELISRKVKEHLLFLADSINKTFKEED